MSIFVQKTQWDNARYISLRTGEKFTLPRPRYFVEYRGHTWAAYFPDDVVDAKRLLHKIAERLGVINIKAWYDKYRWFLVTSHFVREQTKQTYLLENLFQLAAEGEDL